MKNDLTNEPAAGEQAGAVAWRNKADPGSTLRVQPYRPDSPGDWEQEVYTAPGAAIAAREQEACKTCGGTGNDPGGLPACRSCVALTQPTTVQQEPDPLLIDSMCMRWRHDFGLQRDADDQLSSGFTDAERDSLRSSMRQLWEEVVGRGFYRPAALKGMQPGERKEGV